MKIRHIFFIKFWVKIFFKKRKKEDYSIEDTTLHNFFDAKVPTLHNFIKFSMKEGGLYYDFFKNVNFRNFFGGFNTKGVIIRLLW